jgi:hypothetical protein
MEILQLVRTVALVAISVSSGSVLHAADVSTLLSELEGATIVAQDGPFLGVISTNSLDAKSITNDLGLYGSNLSVTSIFNDLCEYGGDINMYSPFCDYTSTPPKMYTRNGRWAYLTVNSALRPRIDPHWLIGILHSQQ